MALNRLLIFLQKSSKGNTSVLTQTCDSGLQVDWSHTRRLSQVARLSQRAPGTQERAAVMVGCEKWLGLHYHTDLRGRALTPLFSFPSCLAPPLVCKFLRNSCFQGASSGGELETGVSRAVPWGKGIKVNPCRPTTG